MSILIDKSTRLIVQGITGRDGLFHARKMKEYGTNFVGGTSPGKGGSDANGIPVFNTCLLYTSIILKIGSGKEECFQTLLCTGNNCCIITEKQSSQDSNRSYRI